MPKPKSRSAASRAPPKSSNPSKPKPKPSKPPAGAFPLVESLQHLVEDQSAWASSASSCLQQLDLLLTRLRALQSASPYYPSLIPLRNPSSLQAFNSWLVSHGLDPSTCPFRLSFVSPHHPDNATLFATRPLSEGDLFVRISEALILTPDLSAASPLRALVDAVPAIASMPSLALVLQLLVEAALPASRFRPYLDILPARFSIPLANFRPPDFEALAPSRAAETAVKTLRATVRDYTHVYTALHRNKIQGLPVSLLSLDNYFWATSVAMTRQNELPVRGSGRFALVPVWDMCNHSPGKATTTVGVSRDGEIVVESRAMRDFAEGEPITMCYGNRPNTELLLYSGFVQPDNENDKVPLDLLLKADADLAKFKAKVVLAKARIAVEELDDGTGWIVPLSVDTSEESIARAHAVARLMAAGKDAIGVLLKSGEVLPRSPLVNENEEARAKEVVKVALESALMEYEKAEERRPEKLLPLAKELVENLHEEEKKLYTGVLTAFANS